MTVPTRSELLVTVNRGVIARMGLIIAASLAIGMGVAGYVKIRAMTTEITVLQGEIAAKIQALTVRDRSLSERAKQIAELQRVTASLRSQVRKYEQELGKAQTSLATTQQDLARRSGELQSARSRLGQAANQLGKAESELQKQKELTGVYYTLSQGALRDYCRALDNEVLLARNSFQNLNRVEAWMELVEAQMRLRIPSDLWQSHRRNVSISEENLRSAEQEQADARALCDSVR